MADSPKKGLPQAHQWLARTELFGSLPGARWQAGLDAAAAQSLRIVSLPPGPEMRLALWSDMQEPARVENPTWP